MQTRIHNLKEQWLGVLAYVLDQAKKIESDSRTERETQIHKAQLTASHIENARLVMDRSTLISKLPKGGVVAEIGVEQGDFSREIYDIAQPTMLHLIDKWGDPDRYHDGLKLVVESKFSSEILQGRVEINVGDSRDVLRQFPDSYFDWVYLDTDHTYEITVNELHVLESKIKPSGYICGHDYCVGNWTAGLRYGVIEAVHQFCVEKNFELIWLTRESHGFESFAIRRISNKSLEAAETEYT